MAGSTNVFWYCLVAVQFFFCLYLLWTRLAKRYPIFTSYLGVSVVTFFGALYFMRGARGAVLPLSYTYYWLWIEPLLLLLQAGVALEIHSALWKQHGSIVRPARPLLLFALLTAIVFAAVPLVSELSRYDAIQLLAVMHFEMLVMRYVSTVLAIFLVLSAVLFFFVVRDGFSTELFRHEGMLAIHFSIYAVVYFLVDIGWTDTLLVNKYMLSAFTLCLVIWISAFKPHQAISSEELP
jgi:hypothetical protein